MSKRLNIRKIAELAGCSPSTVSRVLSGKSDNIHISEMTRKRIMAICQEHEYMPSIHAARFFSRESKVIGFIIPADISLEDDNLARCMNALYLSLRQTGYRFLPVVYDKEFINNKGHINLFMQKEIDAAIIWGARPDPTWLEQLREREMPFMLLSNRNGDFPAVTCDNAAGIRAMLAHCRSKGATRFACVSLPESDIALQRLEGFCSAIGNSEHQIFQSPGISIESAGVLVPDILAYRPDAVICCNDRIAIGVENGLRAAGLKVPDDVLLTGADNIELSDYCPVPLTTFDQMARVCAGVCADQILAHLQKKQALNSVTIAPEIIIRTSA